MSTIDTLLVDRGPGETRVAAVSGERVVEVYHHRAGLPGAGAVYRGRAGKPLSGARSVFVEIGLDRPALMACGASPPHEGAVVDVRIVQPPRGGKGAKVALAHDLGAAQVGADITVPGCLVEAEHPVSFCARTYTASLKRILVTPNDLDRQVAGIAGPDLEQLIRSDASDVFLEYGVDESIERALESVAPFEGGGKLIIEHTAALTAIDVDAGPMSASDANRAALDQLAYELRLRAMAGPMVVDLIPCKGRGELVDRLKRAVADDPVATRVSGLTPEGRIELNRRRSRSSLADLLLAERPATYLSPEAISFHALRQCVQSGLQSGSVRITLRASESVVSLLRGALSSALAEAEGRLKTSLTLQVVPDADISYVDIVTA